MEIFLSVDFTQYAQPLLDKAAPVIDFARPVLDYCAPMIDFVKENVGKVGISILGLGTIFSWFNEEDIMNDTKFFIVEEPNK